MFPGCSWCLPSRRCFVRFFSGIGLSTETSAAQPMRPPEGSSRHSFPDSKKPCWPWWSPPVPRLSSELPSARPWLERPGSLHPRRGVSPRPRRPGLRAAGGPLSRGALQGSPEARENHTGARRASSLLAPQRFPRGFKPQDPSGGPQGAGESLAILRARTCSAQSAPVPRRWSRPLPGQFPPLAPPGLLGRELEGVNSPRQPPCRMAVFPSD